MSLSAQASPAKVFRSLAAEPGLGMLEVLCSLRLPDWLKQSGLRICFSKTYPDSCHTIRGGHLRPSSPRWATWGIMSSGLCLTAPLITCRNPGEGCSLSAILIPDASEKYYLSSEMVKRLLYSSSAVPRATGSTTSKE